MRLSIIHGWHINSVGNVEYSLAENLGWKPRYTKSSGQFKGKLYLIRNSDMKRVRATVTGVVANEIGYGTAVVKGVRSLKVEVKYQKESGSAF